MADSHLDKPNACPLAEAEQKSFCSFLFLPSSFAFALAKSGGGEGKEEGVGRGEGATDTKVSPTVSTICGAIKKFFFFLLPPSFLLSPVLLGHRCWNLAIKRISFFLSLCILTHPHPPSQTVQKARLSPAFSLSYKTRLCSTSPLSISLLTHSVLESYTAALALRRKGVDAWWGRWKRGENEWQFKKGRRGGRQATVRQKKMLPAFNFLTLGGV